MRNQRSILPSRWQVLLAALPCGTSVAVAAYHLAGPTIYHDFLAGQLTYKDLTARPSYWVGTAFLIGTVAALAALGLLAGRVEKRLGGPALEAYLRLLVYASLPMVLWLGGLSVDMDPRLGPVYLATALVITVSIFVALGARARTTVDQGSLTRLAGFSGLAPFMASMAGISLIVATSRIAATWRVPGIEITEALALLCFLLCFLFLVDAWSREPASAEAVGRRLRRNLITVQAFFPVAFFVLVPTSWQVEGVVRQVFQLEPALFLLITLLMLSAWADLARRAVRGDRSDPGSALSPWCLSAVLVLIRLPTVTLPSPLGHDDYHLGEKLLPWWQWKSFGLEPYVDFSPVHGFIDVLYGLVADLFFGPTAAAFAPATNVVSAAAFTLLLLGLSRVVGPLPAFLLALIAPTKGHVYFAVIFVICLLAQPKLLRRRPLWLACWAASGTLLVLFAPGQGAAFVMASLPFGLTVAYRAFRADRRGFLRFCAAAAVAVAVLALATPWGRIVLGSIRYGLESAAVNSVAFAKNWSLAPKNQIPAATGIWELARVAWIPVALVTLLSIPSVLTDPSPERRQRRLFLAGTILLFLILMVPYSMGRNPPARMARAGLLSAVSLSLFLPLLVLTRPPGRHPARTLVLLVLAASLLVPIQARPALRPIKLLRVASKLFKPPPNIVDGASIDLPRLGLAAMSSDELDRLVTLNESLGAWLEPGETYLDLTNHNAQYFYLGYPAPMESFSYFNLVHPAQQRRSIARLEENPPPAILIWSDGVLLDQVLPLRSHLLYRWALAQRYRVVRAGDLVFLVRPDRVRKGDRPVAGSTRTLAGNRPGFRNGVSVGSPAAILPASPLDIVGVEPGDVLVLARSGPRTVTRVLSDRLVLDGPPLDPDRDGQPARIRIRRKAALRDLEVAVLEWAFLKKNLNLLPVSWGRSAATLEERMTPGIDLGKLDEVRLIREAERTPEGDVLLGSLMAAVRYNIQKVRPAGTELGLLRLELECGQPPEGAAILEAEVELEEDESDEAWAAAVIGRAAADEEIDETELYISWHSELKEPVRMLGMRFLARSGEVIVPLDASPRWLLAKGIAWLQVQLTAPGACDRPVIKGARLEGRRL